MLPCFGAAPRRNVQHMAKKPRVSVSLDPDDYAALVELSEANGESVSSIVAGLVAAVSPALRRVAEVVRVAQAAQGEVLENLRRVAEEGEAVLSPMLADGIEAWEQMTADMLGVGDSGGVHPPVE